MLTRVMNNTSCYNLDNRDMLREVMVKIGLERIDTQEGVTVEALLDSMLWQPLVTNTNSNTRSKSLNRILL